MRRLLALRGGLPGARSKKTLIRTDGTEELLPSKIDRVKVNEGDLLLAAERAVGVALPVGQRREFDAARLPLRVVFKDVVAEAGVDGALAASVFHSGAIAIGDLKNYLLQQRLEIRP